MKISDEALQASAVLADRYIQDRHLPDKAIDLIDEAGSRLRIKTMTAPPRYRELEDEIEKVRKDLGDQQRILEDDLFSRVRDMLVGKVAAGGPNRLKGGTKIEANAATRR